MSMIYAVELTAGPLEEGVDVAEVAGRLCEELNERDELDAAVGGQLDSRTIGLSARWRPTASTRRCTRSSASSPT
jgi:hypothetical protein